MSRSVLASVIATLERKVRKKCQPLVHLGAARRPSPASRAAARPVPTPNQPGTIWRDCVQPNTHGIARSRRGPAPESGRRDGREPMLQRRRAARPAWRRRSTPAGPGRSTSAAVAREGRVGDRVHRRVPARRASSAAARGARVQHGAPRATAARVSSRFSRASAGSEVLVGDDLALLGHLDLAVERARTAGPGSRRGSGRRRGRPCRRGRGRAAAGRRGGAATSRSARWARWISHWLVVMPASLLESE